MTLTHLVTLSFLNGASDAEGPQKPAASDRDKPNIFSVLRPVIRGNLVPVEPEKEP